MKAFIIFLGLFASIVAHASYPLSQEAVDKMIKTALELNVERLKEETKALKWTCRYSSRSNEEGKGKKEDEAINNLQLICMKKQCETLQSEISLVLGRVLALSEDHSYDLPELAGKTEAEIKEILAKRNNDLSTDKMNCSNSAAFRTMVFDSCYSVQTDCKKKGFF